MPTSTSAKPSTLHAVFARLLHDADNLVAVVDSGSEGDGMGLERDAEERLKQVFGGRTCCKCNRPAVRIIRKRFYCSRHYSPAGRILDEGKSHKHPKF